VSRSRAIIIGIAVFGVAVVAIGVAVYKAYKTGLVDPGRQRFAQLELKLETLSAGNSDNAIVFVHGLDGEPIGTFTADGAPSWPALLRSDKRPFAGGTPPLSDWAIYAVDYRRVYASDNNINEGARQIGGLLRSSGILARHNHIFFVTHSLGGLLVKRMLLIFNSERRDLALSRIAGVFFFGVPAGGSELAALAQDERAQALLTIIGRNYRAITDLQPEKASAFLGSLEEDWNDFLRARAKTHIDSPPYTHCAYETDKAYLLAKVVEKLYSQMCRDENSMPMSGTHMSIVKPRSIESPQPYGWVRDALAADDARLRRWPWINKTPGAEPLGGIVRQYQQDHLEGPDDFGLLRVPEQIGYRDRESEATAEHFLLAPNFYKGSTVADLIRDVREHNNCVSVSASPDQRIVTLGIEEGSTKSCRGWKEPRVVCVQAECPR
jgi:hypothetical protein